MALGQPERLARHPRIGRGFTLIELMLVVAVIGVIAAVAIPGTRNYVYRSKRTEAIVNLRGIFAAQHAYKGSEGEYGDTFDEIGFSILGGESMGPQTIVAPVYTYTVQALSHDGVPRMNFQAIATGDIDPSDAMLDILMIENNLTVVE